MNKVCPSCRVLININKLNKTTHYLAINEMDYTCFVYEGRCRECRNGIIISVFPFCNTDILWTKKHEQSLIDQKWVTLSKKHKKCLYLYKAQNVATIKSIGNFIQEYKGNCMLVVREGDYGSIKECAFSNIPLIILPNKMFEFSDEHDIPCYFAERLMTFLFDDIYSVDDCYLEKIKRYLN